MAAGLQIIATYIGPEVIITQGQDWENSFFWNGVEVFSRQDDTPHIALSTASRNIMWIALLDSTALGCKTACPSLYVCDGDTDNTCNSME